MEIKLNSEFEDALREIVTIGAGNAATALSQMLKKRIDVAVPKVHLLPVARATDVFGSLEEPVTAIYLKILGDVTGVILFSFNNEYAQKLSDLLLGQEQGTKRPLDDLSFSAIKEAATILTGSYLSAMSKLLKLRLLISTPGLAQDMAGAIVSNVLTETSKEADKAIVVDSEFTAENEKVMCYFFFIPDTGSTEKLMQAAGLA
jgi:chemotaxis protein CheC